MALIVFATLVRIPLVFTPLTYRLDIWRQADTASIARNYSRGDFRPFHPQINWGGSGPGYVETEFPLQPLLTSGLYRVFGEHVWFGRAISLSFGVMAMVAVWWLARRLLDERGALIALGFFAFSPIFVRYSTAFMPEATMLAFMVLAVYLFVRWLDDPTWQHALAAGAVTGLAGLVKPTALHLGLTFAVLLMVKRPWRQWISAQSLTIAAMAVVPVAAWLAHARSLHLDYGNTFGVISGGDEKAGDLEMYTSLSPYIDTAQLDVKWVLGFVGVPLFAVGLWRAVSLRRWLLPVGTAAVGLMYLAAFRYASGIGPQYHVHLLLFAALAVGLGAVWLLDRYGTTGFVTVGVLGGLFVLISGFWYVDQFEDRAAGAMACAGVVDDVVADGELVVVSSGSPSVIDGRFTNNFQNPVLFFHADVYGWSLPRERHTAADLDRLTAEGAEWFVITNRNLADADASLRRRLAGMQQVGPGLTEGCGVYALG